MSDAFIIDNAIPFKNGMTIRGYFLPEAPKVAIGETLEALKDGKRVGLVRIIGVLGINYSYNKERPPYHFSVAFEGDYRQLIGCTLRTFKS